MKSSAQSAPRPPMRQETTSLVSASIPTHVQTSPQPISFFSGVTFLAFAPTYAHISSHWSRRTDTLRTCLSWKAMHAWPRSTRSFVTVFRATPVIREVERMLLPSTRAATTLTRSSCVSVFIMSIMLELIKMVKHFVHFVLDNSGSIPYHQDRRA